MLPRTAGGSFRIVSGDAFELLGLFWEANWGVTLVGQWDVGGDIRALNCLMDGGQKG